MSYGCTIINDDNKQVLGGDGDALKFITKTSSYTLSTYRDMRLMTFTITSTKPPIVYIYMPYDTVGTCSISSFTDRLECEAGGGVWTSSDLTKINMAAVHSVHNVSGNSWEVVIRGARGGYPSDIVLYIFNELGTDVSSGMGMRVYKSNGETSFDTNLEPLLSRYGAIAPSPSPLALEMLATSIIPGGGTWGSIGVSKPAFLGTGRDMHVEVLATAGGLIFANYRRSYYITSQTGLGKRFTRCSDNNSANAKYDIFALASAGGTDTWYTEVVDNIPVIDGADYD
jgi:hypothetical protein